MVGGHANMRKYIKGLHIRKVDNHCSRIQGTQQKNVGNYLTRIAKLELNVRQPP